MNWALENYNIASDERSRGPAEKPVLYLDDGGEIELPMTWGVCPVCEGRGKHVNPSIDAGGLSAEDFAEDPDFAEDYMRGTYDVPCNRCNGRTTVPVVDWNALSDDERKQYEQQLRDDADDRACHLAEIRAGA